MLFLFQRGRFCGLERQLLSCRILLFASQCWRKLNSWSVGCNRKLCLSHGECSAWRGHSSGRRWCRALSHHSFFGSWWLRSISLLVFSYQHQGAESSLIFVFFVLIFLLFYQFFIWQYFQYLFLIHRFLLILFVSYQSYWIM